MKEKLHRFIHNIDLSALVTVIGIIVLFSGAIMVTLIAPRYIDSTWTSPSSSFQVQMYEVADPNVYISSALTGSTEIQHVYHIKEGFTLLAFHETDTAKIIAPPELEKYVTHHNDTELKLTSRLLLVRNPARTEEEGGFNAEQIADKLSVELQEKWEKDHPKWKEEKIPKPNFSFLELYEPKAQEAFAVAPAELLLENWVDSRYVILDDQQKQPWHVKSGVIYINNPKEYRVSHFAYGNEKGWRYDPNGQAVSNLQELKSHSLGFRSREELIKLGEHIYAIEGCWYCHTDQTRTLIQDVVLNGSDSYPAPPSAANEYIYQRITFPGTRRIGPDISRTGVKRPSRDWHKGHFWSPKTASKGSIMPSFQHFFDYDPRGTSKATVGIPNYQFEAIFQYLMTKGTRITPPTQAWWNGKDPIQTKEIIDGLRKLPP